MPSRIQRKRTRGWRKPAWSVIVDRTSRYGNPFRIINDLTVQAPANGPYEGRHWMCRTNADARRQAADLYDDWLNGTGPDTYTVNNRLYDRRRILADVPRLRGRDIVCTCPLPEPGQPDHCHGARILARANREVDQ